VQLAFLGKIGEHAAAVLGLVSYCFDTLKVDRVIYVGGDDAIELALKASGSERRPAFDLSSAGFWQRSLSFVDATPASLGAFITEEQQLLSLLRLETVAWEEQLPTATSIAQWGPFHIRTQLTPGQPESTPRQLDSTPLIRELVVLGAENEASLPESDQSLRFAPGSLSEAGLLVLNLGSEPNRLVEAQLLDRQRQCKQRCRLHLSA
jgi:hypothetical protein